MKTSLFAFFLLNAFACAAIFASDDLLTEAQKHFQALPDSVPGTQATTAQIELGRKLFFEPRLSSNGTVSCMKCHQPSLHGTDSLPKAIGMGVTQTPRNAPTIFNIGFNTLVHWRGDRATLEEQAAKSWAGPNFGNADAAAVLARLSKIPGYAQEFQLAYPQQTKAITYENMAAAVGAFERSLVSPSAFDSYLKGTETLNTKAREGLKTFMDVGCVKCHGGTAMGGTAFRKFGVYDDYWKYTGSAPIDKGRFDITGKEADMYYFKVPSLRNVARTAPYFHDGSVVSLSQAVLIMGKVQLNTDLNSDQVSNIVAFLETLTGLVPATYSIAPTLPPGAFIP